MRIEIRRNLRTPVKHILGETINKWDLLKVTEKLQQSKGHGQQIRTWQPTEWKKILTNSTSDKGLISKIYKELKKLVIKRKNNPIKNGVQT